MRDGLNSINKQITSFTGQKLISMILFRFFTMTFVTEANFLKSNVRSEVTYILRAMDARLQTATYNKSVWSFLNATLIQYLETALPIILSYLILTGVLYDLCAQITAFDGAQILLVALTVAGVLVKHIRRTSLSLRLNDSMPQLLGFYHTFCSALLFVPLTHSCTNVFIS